VAFEPDVVGDSAAVYNSVFVFLANIDRSSTMHGWIASTIWSR